MYAMGCTKYRARMRVYQPKKIWLLLVSYRPLARAGFPKPGRETFKSTIYTTHLQLLAPLQIIGLARRRRRPLVERRVRHRLDPKLLGRRPGALLDDETW